MVSPLNNRQPAFNGLPIDNQQTVSSGSSAAKIKLCPAVHPLKNPEEENPHLNGSPIEKYK